MRERMTKRELLHVVEDEDCGVVVMSGQVQRCPSCGYLPTMSSEALRGILASHFPGLPLMEMAQRGWISLEKFTIEGEQQWTQANVSDLLTHVQRELQKFFRVPDVESLKELLGWAGELEDGE